LIFGYFLAHLKSLYNPRRFFWIIKLIIRLRKAQLRPW